MFLFLCNFHETQAAIHLMPELVGSIGFAGAGRWSPCESGGRPFDLSLGLLTCDRQSKKKKVDKFPSQEANIIITRPPHRKQYQFVDDSTDENNFFQGNWT